VRAAASSSVLRKLLWSRLEDAMTSRHGVLVISDATRTRGDGKVVVGTVIVRVR
jgi:hypothetical protein